jgi:hypothetical protein
MEQKQLKVFYQATLEDSQLSFSRQNATAVGMIS